jgi:hypothetical protein
MYISWISCFALPCTLLGILSRILAVLWTRATLLRDWAVFFLQGDPESKRTVADGQLRCGGKQFTPGLGTFAVTINDS